MVLGQRSDFTSRQLSSQLVYPRRSRFGRLSCRVCSEVSTLPTHTCTPVDVGSLHHYFPVLPRPCWHKFSSTAGRPRFNQGFSRPAIRPSGVSAGVLPTTSAPRSKILTVGGEGTNTCGPIQVEVTRRWLHRQVPAGYVEGCKQARAASRYGCGPTVAGLPGLERFAAPSRHRQAFLCICIWKVFQAGFSLAEAAVQSTSLLAMQLCLSLPAAR